MDSINPQPKRLAENLEKATYKGERGKFRRLKGKTVFIRSKDKKVMKGPKKGKKLLMKSAEDSSVFAQIKENLDTIIKNMEQMSLQSTSNETDSNEDSN